jgi:hypothetical protein
MWGAELSDTGAVISEICMARREPTRLPPRWCCWFLCCLLPAGCTPSLRSVDPDELFSCATHLVEDIGPRVPGTPQHAKASEYLRETLKSYGLAEVSFEDSGLGAGLSRNVVARVKGTTHPDWIILAGAHYDTIKGCVGAMDNASGVATLLGTAKYFATHPPAYTMEFVFFDREETGYGGSKAHHRQSKEAGTLARTLVMLNLDMTQGNYLTRRYPAIFLIMTPNLAVLNAAQKAHLRTGLCSMSICPLSTGTAKAMAGGLLRSDVTQWSGDRVLLVWPWAYALPPYFTRVPGSIAEIDKHALATATQFSIDFLCALQDRSPEEIRLKP